ncbi:hypothetical protein V1517DRAFT_310220 [Lipomyces orientalis]|uniref:Uncharacterized protein n=1 Tax=Lipomyces orientalis TaxID=1233043 RepID=A0ACC3TFQ8_9ASCO
MSAHRLLSRTTLCYKTLKEIINETRTIYTSRSFGKPKNDKWVIQSCVILGRLGLAKIKNLQPHIYRAPEVTFDMNWGSHIDIWNLGALIWDLFEVEHLFHHLKDEGGKYDPLKHMAQISGFLGLPPIDFILRSETSLQCSMWKYFNRLKLGHWKAGEHAKIPTTSLEDVETRLEGTDKYYFFFLFGQCLTGVSRSVQLQRSSSTIPG